MSGRRFTEERVGQFMFDQFSHDFAIQVQSRTRVIEKKAKKKYKEFFDDIEDLIGTDNTPGVIAGRVETWEMLSAEWARKKKVGRGNAFYRGLGRKEKDPPGGTYLSEMTSKTAAQRYGPLKLSIRTGSSDRDPDKIKFDEKMLRFRYKGQFASVGQVGVRVVLQAFPWVKRNKDLQRRFSPRVQNILQRNEPWGGSSLKDGLTRPFLTPMMNYYVEEVLPNVVRKTVGTR